MCYIYAGDTFKNLINVDEYFKINTISLGIVLLWWL